MRSMSGLITFLKDLKHREETGEVEIGFDMNREHQNRDSSKHPCGSACCIGGWCALLLEKEYLCITEALVEYTGIPEDDAELICWPPVEKFHDYSVLTIDHAINVLENYVKTGIVDWSLEI